MIIGSFIIDGISNIEHIRLNIGDINALDMSAIRNKRIDVLAPQEEALGVVI